MPTLYVPARPTQPRFTTEEGATYDVRYMTHGAQQYRAHSGRPDVGHTGVSQGGEGCRRAVPSSAVPSSYRLASPPLRQVSRITNHRAESSDPIGKLGRPQALEQNENGGCAVSSTLSRYFRSRNRVMRHLVSVARAPRPPAPGPLPRGVPSSARHGAHARTRHAVEKRCQAEKAWLRFVWHSRCRSLAAALTRPRRPRMDVLPSFIAAGGQIRNARGEPRRAPPE